MRTDPQTKVSVSLPATTSNNPVSTVLSLPRISPQATTVTDDIPTALLIVLYILLSFILISVTFTLHHLNNR